VHACHAVVHTLDSSFRRLAQSKLKFKEGFILREMRRAEICSCRGRKRRSRGRRRRREGAIIHFSRGMGGGGGGGGIQWELGGGWLRVEPVCSGAATDTLVWG